MNKDDRPAARGSLVYSSETGSICPRCQEPHARCSCGADPPVPRAQGVVRVGRQTHGRRGKAVTVIEGVSGTPGRLAELARELKRRCGSGGTVKNGVIEIQGDHRDLLIDELRARGFRVKRAGG